MGAQAGGQEGRCGQWSEPGSWGPDFREVGGQRTGRRPFPSIVSQTCCPFLAPAPRSCGMLGVGPRGPSLPPPGVLAVTPLCSARPLGRQLLLLSKLGFLIFNLLYRIMDLDLILPFYNLKYHVCYAMRINVMFIQ